MVNIFHLKVIGYWPGWIAFAYNVSKNWILFLTCIWPMSCQSSRNLTSVCVCESPILARMCVDANESCRIHTHSLSIFLSIAMSKRNDVNTRKLNAKMWSIANGNGHKTVQNSIMNWLDTESKPNKYWNPYKSDSFDL